MEIVYSAVRTDSIYKADYVWSLKGLFLNGNNFDLSASFPDILTSSDFKLYSYLHVVIRREFCFKGMNIYLGFSAFTP
jgi:hypothetical protein